MTGTRALAAAQTLPKRGDVDANVTEHLWLADIASREGARVLVFPELSLTGYELDLAEELAFTQEDPRLEPLRGAAADGGLTLVVGAPVRLEERLHIGAFLLSPDRSVELYTKHHLGTCPAQANPGGLVPPPEATVFQPGERNPLLQVDGHPAAVAVCADTNHASHPAAAAERGAKAYLAGVFCPATYLEEEHANLRGHAVRHSMAVVMANFGGPSGGLESAGGSAIWSEEGERLVQLEGSGTGIAIAIEEDAGWRARTVATG